MLDSTHPILENGLRHSGFEVVGDFKSSKAELLKSIHQFDGLVIRSRFKMDAAFISAAHNLKFIGRFGAGLENIDVPFAESKGIICIRVPEGNRNAVAEHALGMLLSLFNHLNRASNEVKNGIWLRHENTGTELAGKTIGIVGYGFMGSAFAEVLRHFAVRILAYDKYKANYAPKGVVETDMPTLFNEADILSIHTPLTEETNQMVDLAYLQQFRKPIYLINTARGPIVKSNDLAEALKTGSVLGACLDVLEQEKTSFTNLFDQDDLPESLGFLLQHDRVIITPHIAGWSTESFEKMARVMLEKIKNVTGR